MARNPILEKIYAAREKLLADHDGDADASVQDARERALRSGHPIATLSWEETYRAMAESDEDWSSWTELDLESAEEVDRS